MLKVAFIEDDKPTREAWELLLNGTPGFRCTGSFGTGEEALKGFRHADYDLAIVDLGLPRMSGVELIQKLKEKRPKLLVCVLTVHEDPEMVFESLKAGATGYILKKTPPGRVLDMLGELLDGGSPMSPVIARKVTQFFHTLHDDVTRLDMLTDRERSILHHLAQGHPDKQIAENLKISPHTVRNHVRHIYEKLQVHSRTGAAAKYLGRG